jgi:hypothetical protein
MATVLAAAPGESVVSTYRQYRSPDHNRATDHALNGTYTERHTVDYGCVGQHDMDNTTNPLRVMLGLMAGAVTDAILIVVSYLWSTGRPCVVLSCLALVALWSRW